ncbi:MAG: MFS transporter [Myxococcota bacterium]
MNGVGTFAFALFSTISAIYRIQEAGLNPLELVLVGTVLELSAFLFEVPTGVVADVYSRRLSVLIGFALTGLGFAVEASNPMLGTILLAQVIWGVGFTFTSGAAEAWIVDELGGRDVGRVFLRSAQISQLAALLGIVLSVSLATVFVALPMFVAGGLFVALSGILAFWMPETGFRPRPREERGSWSTMRRTLGVGVAAVRSRPALVLILLVALFTGTSSEPLDRLWEIHLLESFTFPDLWGLDPVLWFGIINGAALLLGVGATELIRRRVDIEDPRAAVRVLLLLNGLLVASVLGFALAGSFFLAVAAYWGTRVFRRTTGPLLATWTNQQLESSVRATVLSMRTQADSLGQVVGGPALGALATWASVRWTFVSVALLLLPVQALYRRARRTEIRRSGDRVE